MKLGIPAWFLLIAAVAPLINSCENQQAWSFASALDRDTESQQATPDPPLLPPNLKYKRLDQYWDERDGSWTYRNLGPNVTISGAGADNSWTDFDFLFVRKLPRPMDPDQEPKFSVIVKSQYILKACKPVLGEWPGISWNTESLELASEILVTSLPRFTAYRNELAAKQNMSEEERHILASFDLLLEWLQTEFRTAITAINDLTPHGEINWEVLYAILIPGSIFLTKCPVTGEPRAFKLVSYNRLLGFDERPYYVLTCQSIDMIDRPVIDTVGVGWVQTTVKLRYFKDTVNITSLAAYPIQYHPDQQIQQGLIERGEKWLALTGVHHMQYNGIAYIRQETMFGEIIQKHRVTGRIMVDMSTFKRRHPDYNFPSSEDRISFGYGSESRHYVSDFAARQPLQVDRVQQLPIVNATTILTNEEFLLTPSVVYGFSFADQRWLEFNVQMIQDVEWNEDAFVNLVIPSNRKALLQSLVEAHQNELGFDDFIRGKGQGLVINLFGPPGVGKTFSAEATSEHLKRPLYVVSAGNLGTDARELDHALEEVFDAATIWKAIVLIDEADVFLEQRSTHDLTRNAMVAVFLRHIEYYRGILFFTTNRVKAFDEAFLSRIHVALHFDELSEESRGQVWAAFLRRIGADITKEQIRALSRRNVNGRQIKNAVKTAQSLALRKGEKVDYRDLMETLDAVEEFAAQFEAVRMRSALAV